MLPTSNAGKPTNLPQSPPIFGLKPHPHPHQIPKFHPTKKNKTKHNHQPQAPTVKNKMSSSGLTRKRQYLLVDDVKTKMKSHTFYNSKLVSEIFLRWACLYEEVGRYARNYGELGGWVETEGVYVYVSRYGLWLILLLVATEEETFL